MQQQKRVSVSDNMKDFVNRRITLIVFDRFRLLLPLLILFTVFFAVTVKYTGFWAGATSKLFYIDLAAMIILIFLGVLYCRIKPEDAAGIGKMHLFLRNTVSFLIVVWAALVTVADKESAGGYITYVVCLMVSIGIIPVGRRWFIVLGVSGILLLHIPYNADGMMPAHEVFLLISTLFLAAVINHLNLSAMEESAMLEHELEQKVEERTRQLELETENAKRADRLKGQFLANMSHEIRTPLNGILGFTKLMMDDGLSRENRHNYIKIVLNCGNNLLVMLNDIIEVSRLESGVCETYTEEFDVFIMLDDVLASFRFHQKIMDGKIELRNSYCGSRPLRMVSDRLKIVQILNNLVNNAIKCTDSGFVEAGFTLPDSRSIEFYVKDTGKGIKAEDQQRIFERFQQVDFDVYKMRDGAGIGLTIVKGYTDLLGGELSMTSELGKGTEFRLTFPLKTDTL